VVDVGHNRTKRVKKFDAPNPEIARKNRVILGMEEDRVNELTDEELHRIWVNQAFKMGLIDNKIPSKRVFSHGLTTDECRKIRRECELAGAADPFLRFAQQKGMASKRGIEWEISFQEWWALWKPYYLQRGHAGKGLEMCRIGDRGSYRTDNVFIASGLENREAKKGNGKRYKPARGH